ncbi:MAG: hypothetical protein AABZ30_12215, partial [Myxococcota bacterium]
CVVVYDPAAPLPCGEADDCATGFACEEAACVPAEVECASSLACAGGRACAAGLCACPPETVGCDGVCRDLATDAAHCGACGVACGEGEDCVLAHCATPDSCATDASCGKDARCTGGACIPVGDVVGSRALPLDGPLFGLAGGDGAPLWALDDPETIVDLVRFEKGGDAVDARFDAPGVESVDFRAAGLALAGETLVYAVYDDELAASDLVAATTGGDLALRVSGAGGAAGEDADGAIWVLRAGPPPMLARIDDLATLASTFEIEIDDLPEELVVFDLAHDGESVWAIGLHRGNPRLLRIDPALGVITLARDAPPTTGTSLTFDGDWLLAAGAERMFRIAR